MHLAAGPRRPERPRGHPAVLHAVLRRLLPGDLHHAVLRRHPAAGRPQPGGRTCPRSWTGWRPRAPSGSSCRTWPCNSSPSTACRLGRYPLPAARSHHGGRAVGVHRRDPPLVRRAARRAPVQPLRAHRDPCGQRASAWTAIPAHWPERPAIGRPVAGAVLRVVDEGGPAVPPGCTGELLIGGTMASRCYLGEPAPRRHPLRRRSPARASSTAAATWRVFDREGLLHYAGRDDEPDQTQRTPAGTRRRSKPRCCSTPA